MVLHAGQASGLGWKPRSPSGVVVPPAGASGLRDGEITSRMYG